MKEITGIVIRLTHFRDNDAMVNVLACDRIYSFIAKGVLKIKSKNASSVNIYTKSRFVLTSSKDGLSLRSGEVLNSYENAKTKLDSLIALDFLGEITNKLIINEDAPMAYLWLEKALDSLNEGFDPLTSILNYVGAILRISGNSLEVDNCLICHQKKPIVAMNYHQGGFICEDCLPLQESPKTPVGELKILRYIFKIDVNNYTRAVFNKTDAIHVLHDLGKFINNQLDVNLKAIQMVDKLV